MEGWPVRGVTGRKAERPHQREARRIGGGESRRPLKPRVAGVNAPPVPFRSLERLERTGAPAAVFHHRFVASRQRAQRAAADIHRHDALLEFGERLRVTRVFARRHLRQHFFRRPAIQRVAIGSAARSTIVTTGTSAGKREDAGVGPLRVRQVLDR